MKKYPNLFLIIALSLFFGAIVVSCSNDEESYQYAVYIATVDKDDKRSFTLDDSTTLYVTESLVGYNTKERAIINFTPLGENYNKHDYAIRINGIYEVLTKPIIYIDKNDDHAMDSIGKKAIIIKRLWEGGGYINIEFEFQFNNGDKPHMINLVNFKKEIAPTETEISLDFSHYSEKENNNGYPNKGYVSFRLGDFKDFTSEKITFTINAKNYNGENVSHKLEYKPQLKEAEKKQQSLPETSSARNSEYY